MKETLDKLWLAGLGALSMTRERAEKIFDDLVQRGQEERTNKRDFVENLVQSADKTRQEVESFVDRQVKQALSRLHVATKDDIARLEAKLDQLCPPPAAAEEPPADTPET